MKKKYLAISTLLLVLIGVVIVACVQVSPRNQNPVDSLFRGTSTKPTTSNTPNDSPTGGGGDGGNGDGGNGNGGNEGGSGGNGLPIQVYVMQTCTGGDSGGVMFKVVPISPSQVVSDFQYIFENTSTSSVVMEQVSINGVLMHNNQAPNNGPASIRITVRKNGYSDLVITDVWGNTCNHDGQPTNCAENTNIISLDKQKYQVGDQLTGTLNGWSGTTAYHITDGLSNVNIINSTITATVVSLPIKLHAQPASNGCHGWTKAYLQ